MSTQQNSISSAIRQNIRSLNLFSTLLDDDIDILARYGRVRSLDKGEALFREGDTGDFFAIILEGTMDICKEVEGDSPVLLNTLGKGSTLGEMAIIDNETRSASAFACEPVTVFTLSRDGFDELVEISPRCGVKIIRKIASLLCENIRRINQ